MSDMPPAAASLATSQHPREGERGKLKGARKEKGTMQEDHVEQGQEKKGGDVKGQGSRAGRSQGQGREQGRGRARGQWHGPGRGGAQTPGNSRGRRRGRGHTNANAQIDKPDDKGAMKEDPSDALSAPKSDSPAKKQAATPKTAPKMRRFGAKLTNSSETPPAAMSSTSRPVSVPEYADLRSRILAELANDEYDCTICYNVIKRRQPIWSCTRCYAVLHLTCVRTWAERSVSQIQEQNAMHQDAAVRETPGHWRCPGCQDVKYEVPRTYKCWCGRITNPTPPPHAAPHSCGSRCKRGCVRHGCPAVKCHPGPCPPCAATVQVTCFCGKEPHMQVRCSQLPRAATEGTEADTISDRTFNPNQSHTSAAGILSCGQLCGKSLACGHHTCPQPCHPGACPSCAITLHEVPCFCGRHTRTMRCGERLPEAAGLNSGWSCQEPCHAPFACGYHSCSRPCHVRSGIAPCPYAPERVKTCPCGRMPLTNRSDCRDPIPTCEATCGKIHPSCGHACEATCHSGPCPPCSMQVLQVCRCGASKRQVPCGTNTDTVYLCQTICKVTRHCGKHQCQRQCCPLAYQAGVSKKMLPTDLSQLDPVGFHACDARCTKTLSCGRHTCDAPCHRGACAPCLRSTFTEVSCTCGRTVLEPPVPCGTQVECSHPCSLPPPPCGHPKIPHTCHPADTPCPPCVHLTSKVCVCGRTTMSAVPCSRRNVRCGEPCRALLACGQHICPGACHAEGECPPCNQVCGRPRPVCGHPCERPCHAPEPCSADEPCRAVLARRCACGHREKLDVCGAAPGIERPPVPPLECVPACKVAQRNARFARALGLDTQREEVSYSATLLQYVAQNPRGSQAVQEVLNEFVQSPRVSAQLRALLTSFAVRRGCEPIKVDAPLLAFTEELAHAYHLEVGLCTPQGLIHTGPVPSNGRDVDVRLRRLRDTRIPTVLLTEFAASHPARTSLEARRLRSAATAARGSATAMGLPTSGASVPRGNALWITASRSVTGEAALENMDQTALATALGDASLGGRRSWTMVCCNEGTLLTHIQLEPQSLAAIASRPKPPGSDALSPIERRLLWVSEDVQRALASAGAPTDEEVLLCSCTEGCQVTHVFRDGRWSRQDVVMNKTASRT